MNTKITLKPRKGIVIDDTLEICFQQTFDDIMSYINLQCVCISNKCYLFDNNLCLEFDANNKLQYIEISNCDIFTLDIWGQNPFKLLDNELITFLNKHCGIDIFLNYDKITDYIIKKQDISLYREISPYELLSSIEEAKINGDYNADMDLDYLMSRFFNTIGIGNNGYFSNA